MKNMFTSLSSTNFYSVIQPFLLCFVPLTQFKSPSRLAWDFRHDLRTLKKRSIMEGIGTHQKFLVPLVFPQLWQDTWEIWHFWHSYLVNCMGTWTGGLIYHESFLCAVWGMATSTTQGLSVWNRWFMNEIKSLCLEIQVDIRERWQIQAKEKLEMLLLFRLHLETGLTWHHSQINSRILQLSELIGS